MDAILKSQNERQNEGEGISLGNPRANRSTGLSYRRPSRDCSKCFKWTLEYNRRFHTLYLEAELSVKGYQKRLKDLWDKEEIENTGIASKHLAEQVRNIRKKNLLKDIDLHQLELEHKI